jgi:hypothetical protein
MHTPQAHTFGWQSCSIKSPVNNKLHCSLALIYQPGFSLSQLLLAHVQTAAVYICAMVAGLHLLECAATRTDTHMLCTLAGTELQETQMQHEHAADVSKQTANRPCNTANFPQNFLKGNIRQQQRRLQCRYPAATTALAACAAAACCIA